MAKKNKFKKYLLVVGSIILGCYLIALLIHETCYDDIMDRCHHPNAIFDKYSITSKKYKKELMEILKRTDSNKVAYYVGSYVVRNGKQFLYIYVKGDSLCANAVLDITNTTKLDDYKKAKGLYYYGCTLYGLKYKIDTMREDCSFIFESLDSMQYEEMSKRKYVCGCW